MQKVMGEVSSRSGRAGRQEGRARTLCQCSRRGFRGLPRTTPSEDEWCELSVPWPPPWPVLSELLLPWPLPAGAVVWADGGVAAGFGVVAGAACGVAASEAANRPARTASRRRPPRRPMASRAAPESSVRNLRGARAAGPVPVGTRFSSCRRVRWRAGRTDGPHKKTRKSPARGTHATVSTPLVDQQSARGAP